MFAGCFFLSKKRSPLLFFYWHGQLRTKNSWSQETAHKIKTKRNEGNILVFQLKATKFLTFAGNFFLNKLFFPPLRFSGRATENGKETQKGGVRFKNESLHGSEIQSRDFVPEECEKEKTFLEPCECIYLQRPSSSLSCFNAIKFKHCGNFFFQPFYTADSSDLSLLDKFQAKDLPAH